MAVKRNDKPGALVAFAAALLLSTVLVVFFGLEAVFAEEAIELGGDDGATAIEQVDEDDSLPEVSDTADGSASDASASQADEIKAESDDVDAGVPAGTEINELRALEAGESSDDTLRAMGGISHSDSNWITIGKSYSTSGSNGGGNRCYRFKLNGRRTVSFDITVKSARYIDVTIYNAAGEKVSNTSNCGSDTIYMGTRGSLTLDKGEYCLHIYSRYSSASYTFSAKCNTSWSGASRLPVSATADFNVSNGGYLRIKSGSNRVTSNSVLSIKSISDTKKQIYAKKTGKATLILCDAGGNQVASKTITVYSITSGNYEIQSSVNSKYVLDIRGRSKKNSARMIVWPRNNQTNQRYRFERKPDGSYMIKCVHSGKYVDVAGGGTAKSQPVIQYSKNSRDNQRWKITVDSGNRISLVCKKSGMCFDIQGGKVSKRAQMIQYPANGGKNQKWVLNKK